MNDTSVPTSGQEIRSRGTIYKVKMLAGFSFAMDENRRSIFLPFSEIENSIIPQPGDTVSFVVGTDREGRPIARSARVETSAEVGSL
jgi:cold shock CspA family protein